MLNDSKMPNKFSDLPRDKPQSERVEHAGLDRPGPQAQVHPHPWARGDWSGYTRRAGAWRWQ